VAGVLLTLVVLSASALHGAEPEKKKLFQAGGQAPHVKPHQNEINDITKGVGPNNDLVGKRPSFWDKLEKPEKPKQRKQYQN
jgi:hypothetical protein